MPQAQQHHNNRERAWSGNKNSVLIADGMIANKTQDTFLSPETAWNRSCNHPSLLKNKLLVEHVNDDDDGLLYM